MTNEIERIELSLEVAEKAVQFGDKVLRLAANKDFDEVINQGYLRDEAARLTGLLGDPNVKEQDEVMKDLHGIAAFQRYMRRQVQMRNMLEKEIYDHREALEQARLEQE